MATVTFDSFNPQNTEAASLGASRIREIGQQLMNLFGLTVSGTGFPASFIVDTADGRLTVVADPTADLGIATKQYVDAAHIAVVPVVDSGPSNYVPTGTGVASYKTDTLYVVQNTRATNTAAGVQLNLGAGFINLTKRDGSTNLAVGDFPAGWYLVVYNGTTFILIDFFGGTLQADPTQALGAATKQYVDNIPIVGPAIVAHLATDPVSVSPGAYQKTQIIADVPVTIPDTPTGVEYAIHADYAVWNATGEVGYTWIEDDQAPTQWGQVLAPVSSGNAGPMAGAGLSPIRYTPGTGKIVKVSVWGAFASSTNIADTGTVGQFSMRSFLNLALVRTHS